MRRKFFWLIFSCAAAFFTPARAQKITPEAWIEDRGRELLKALADPSMKRRQGLVLRLAENSFNAKELSRLAMGRYWVEFSPEQKARFQSLFMRYFVVTYTAAPLPVQGVTFRVQGTAPSGKDLLVKTSVNLASAREFQESLQNANEIISMSGVSLQAATLTLIFALRSVSDGYYVRDVQVEGQSMLLFLRRKLEDEFRKSNYDIDVLLEGMDEKIRTAVLNANVLERSEAP